jgi:hypothetical protein
VKQSAGGDVGDQSVAWGIRQDLRHRQHHFAPVAGDPHVHATVGPFHLVVAEMKAPADVEQALVATHPGQLRHADHLVLRR